LSSKAIPTFCNIPEVGGILVTSPNSPKNNCSPGINVPSAKVI
jgi:hypothetical protein